MSVAVFTYFFVDFTINAAASTPLPGPTPVVNHHQPTYGQRGGRTTGYCGNFIPRLSQELKEKEMKMVAKREFTVDRLKVDRYARIVGLASLG
uniref:Putative secreted protein n=1 Tax=Anopheles marajoara TaxID=58244 RepID=A0A2M4C9I9_9DIPT